VITAFLDANVLVPITLADTILRCAEGELFRPLWSQRVLDEVQRTLTRLRPDLTPSRIDHRIRSMCLSFPEAMVTGYEVLIDGITLPDPDDRHVLAAASFRRADLVVSNNAKHFPATTLAAHGLEVVTADDFLQDMLDLSYTTLQSVIRQQAADSARPALTEMEILDRLQQIGAAGFVRDYRAHA